MTILEIFSKTAVIRVGSMIGEDTERAADLFLQAAQEDHEEIVVDFSGLELLNNEELYGFFVGLLWQYEGRAKIAIRDIDYREAILIAEDTGSENPFIMSTEELPARQFAGLEILSSVLGEKGLKLRHIKLNGQPSKEPGGAQFDGAEFAFDVGSSIIGGLVVIVFMACVKFISSAYKPIEEHDLEYKWLDPTDSRPYGILIIQPKHKNL